MKNYLIRLFLYIAIALVPIACGTRKVESEKTRIDNKTLNESSKEGESNKYQAITTQEEAISTNTTTNKTVETIKTKEYDAITGNLIKDQKLTRTGDYKQVKLDINHRTTNNITHFIEKWKIKNKVLTRTITVHKSKESESKRDGLYWILFGLGVVALAFWLKPWVR